MTLSRSDPSNRNASKSFKVAANGLQHHVLAWDFAAAESSESTDAIFLLHGFMDAAGTWDLVAPTLAPLHKRVFAPDMRGFGDTDRAPLGSYYHFPDYVADLADLIDALCGNGAVVALVGHSMGGTIAALFAGTFPERVRSLILIEGLGPPDNPTDVAPTRMRRWLDDLRAFKGKTQRTFSLDEGLERLAGQHPVVDRETLRSRMVHLVREVSPARFAWKFDPLHRTQSPFPFFAESFNAFSARVDCPVLFIGGGPTGYHPDDEETRLASFQNLLRIEFTDGGHMIHWTKPLELGAAIRQFVHDHP